MPISMEIKYFYRLKIDQSFLEQSTIRESRL